MAGDEKNTSSERPANQDDLTCIRGINPKIANRLYNAGILTFAKLAAMSPEEIVSRIGPSAGVSVETITKRNWTGQAALLSEAKNKPTNGEAETTVLQAVSYVIELFVDKNKRVQKTRVYHVQSNEDEDWKNWQESNLLAFFHKRPELALPKSSLSISKQDAGPIATSSGALPSPEENKRVSYATPVQETRIESKAQKEPSSSSLVPSPTQRLFVNPSLNGLEIILANEKIPSQVISSNWPFYLQLVMDVSSLSEAKYEQINYSALVSAQNLRDRRCQIIGQGKGIIEPTRQATLNLEGKSISPGIYRLSALVTLCEAVPAAVNQRLLRASLSGKLIEVY